MDQGRPKRPLDVLRALHRQSSALARLHEYYWRVRLWALDDTHTAELDGHTADFGIQSRSEYVRATTFGGEQSLLGQFLNDLDGDEVVWDVGACVGTYACFASTALPEGHVVAFEPEPLNRRRLTSNLQRNAPASHWTVSDNALAASSRPATLQSAFVEAGGGHHYLADDGTTPVDARPGDSLVERGVVPSPDVVKIDVQGAELLVLNGIETLLADVTTVYLEVHREKTARYDATPEEVESFLQARGFDLESLGEPTDGRTGVYFLRASR